MIHVIATIQVVPNRRSAFLEEFRRIVPDVRAEKGCIEYGPTVDVDAGIAGLPGVREEVVTVVEKWESANALDAHLKSAHMLLYREAVKELVVAVDIRVMEPT